MYLTWPLKVDLNSAREFSVYECTQKEDDRTHREMRVSRFSPDAQPRPAMLSQNQHKGSRDTLACRNVCTNCALRVKENSIALTLSFFRPENFRKNPNRPEKPWEISENLPTPNTFEHARTPPNALIPKIIEGTAHNIQVQTAMDV